MFQRLIDEHAVVVAESTVREHIRALREVLGADVGSVTIVAVHPAGEEAEVDFGEAMVFVGGSPPPGRQPPQHAAPAVAPVLAPGRRSATYR